MSGGGAGRMLSVAGRAASALLRGRSISSSPSTALRVAQGRLHDHADASAAGGATGVVLGLFAAVGLAGAGAGAVAYADAGSSVLSEEYRKKVFFNYERRIRAKSSPEKVFDYFASVKKEDGSTYMTSTDMMRAVIPVLAPAKSHETRTGSLAGEKVIPKHLETQSSEVFRYFDLDGDGVYDFNEYLLMHTLISIPERDLANIFRLVDFDNSGTISYDEFIHVIKTVRKNSSLGRADEKVEGIRTGMKYTPSDFGRSGLARMFFGRRLTSSVKIDAIIDFISKVHQELSVLEFSHYDFENRGKISPADFAASLVASADLAKMDQYLARIHNIDSQSFPDVSKEDFMKMAALRRRINDLALATRKFLLATGPLTKEVFMRAVHRVCGVELPPALIDVIFYVFDTDGDGSLSADEFFHSLMEKEHIQDSNDGSAAGTGVGPFFSCCHKCLVDKLGKQQ